MKKVIIIVVAVVLIVGAVVGIILLGGNGDGGGGDIVIDDQGNVKPGADGSVTTVKFWGWGESGEVEVFSRIVDAFNAKYKDVIYVDYVQRPSGTYGESLLTTLAGSKGPDVLYVEDRYFKQYATLGYLADLTEKYNKSTVIDEDEMFPNTISRYRYNTVTTTSNPSDPLYAVPKDLAPTAIYYNKTLMTNAGVTIISLSEEEVLAKIAQGSKVSLIKGGTADYTVRGFDPVGNVFNNKVAMNWEDCLLLSRLIMEKNPGVYGFYSEWWFNYGWTVGGDCTEYVPTDDPAYNGGRYMFTLSDGTKNYIVKDDFVGQLTVNGTAYSAGQIISYTDKMTLTPEQKEHCNELPSQREAFTEFVRLSQKISVTVDSVEAGSDFYGADATGELKGYGITPNPNTISSDGKNGYFTSGKLGMLVTTMSAVKQINANMRDEWDVAPMLVYKEYSDDGKSVLVHGVEAAHSGSVGIAVSAKSKCPDAAYLFAEYIASAEAQAIQAEEGFAIPLQKSVANSSVYLEGEYMPDNVAIFIDACYYETPGDWWYLYNKKWIDDWASLLNGDVRNGEITLTEFYDSQPYKSTQAKLDEYTKKKD